MVGFGRSHGGAERGLRGLDTARAPPITSGAWLRSVVGERTGASTSYPPAAAR